MKTWSLLFQIAYLVWQEISSGDMTHVSHYYLPVQGLHQPFLAYWKSLVEAPCNGIASQQPASRVACKGFRQIIRLFPRVPYFLKGKSTANNSDSRGLEGCSPEISDHLLQQPSILSPDCCTTHCPNTLICSWRRYASSGFLCLQRCYPMFLQYLLLSQFSIFFLPQICLSNTYPNCLHWKFQSFSLKCSAPITMLCISRIF